MDDRMMAPPEFIQRICTDLEEMYNLIGYAEDTKLDSFARMASKIEQLIEDEKGEQ